MPGYYRCPDLCGVVMHGVLEALQKSASPRSGYRVLASASTPPRRAPMRARSGPRTLPTRRSSTSRPHRRLHRLPSSPPSPALDLRLLTGPPASIEALAERSGFRYRRSEPRREAATPAKRRGRIPPPSSSSPPAAASRTTRTACRLIRPSLRRALVQASGGRIGTFAERIALLCASLDLRQGPYSAAVWRGLQATALLTLVGLALLWWRLTRRGGAA
ncbi:MAG: hypothetical protein U1F25_08880 [Rubrivivax sp.]